MLERFRKPTKPIADLIAKYFTWLHPNMITIMGFLLGFIPAYFFINGQPRIAGIGVLVTFFDFLDGAVARFTGRVSIFGEVLDASLDRVIDGLIIFSIAQGGFVSWNLAMIVLIGFYMVSYIRARAGEASAKKVKLNVGLAQRGERIIVLIIASIFYFDNILIPFVDIPLNSLELAFIVLGVFAWQTAILRLVTAYKRLK